MSVRRFPDVHPLTRKSFIGGLAAVVAAGGQAAERGAISAVSVKGADLFGGGHLATKAASWRKGGFNLVLIDVQDSVRYPSHPEIATARSLPPEKVGRAVAVLKECGMDVVPLLDFATCNDGWLGEYDRMVCSKRYDAVVRDLIRDAYGIFDTPKFIHLGFGDEGRSTHPPGGFAVMRQGDLWMRYLVRTAGWVKETGARAWAWFDYPWGMKDFLADCPRDIVYSNLKPLSEKRTADRILQVVKAGCDVIPFVRGLKDSAVAARLPSAHVLGMLKEVAG